MASSNYQVLSPERVVLQYDIAGIGSRGAAVLVDSAIQALALCAVGLLVVSLGAVFRATATTVSIIVGVVLFALVTLGYYLFFELVWSGQTPGKRLLGLRVIRESGYPIRPADAVVRNLVRIVDGFPFMYAVGILTMLLNARSKRLGDFAAGTIVVREGVRGPSSLEVAGPNTDPGPTGVLLQPSDATLVRDFLVRRGMMDDLARAELAERIASAIARRYGVQVTSEAESFLEGLDA